MDSYVIQNMKFERELIDNSIECLECLPLCSKSGYRVSTTNFPLNRNGLLQTESNLL